MAKESVITKDPKYIPYTLRWDDMPIDISFVFKDEKPAGRHGFLTVKNDKFVFEDTKEAKFWGVNFNSGANFPTHQHSENVARRLAKTGINIVRFHQLDAEWATPNIFQFEKGELKDNTLSLDTRSMERLDYLIHCLKNEGIYVYLDLMTYRKFKSGDGVEVANLLNESAKPYSNFNRRLIELQKKINYDVWNHVNPYTGLAYKDEPAIVLAEITNECDLFHLGRNSITVEPYRSELEAWYRNWAKEQDISLKDEKVDFDLENGSILQFLCYVQKAYYLEIMKHLREIGVKIPITGTNWSINAALLSCQMVTDYTDSHAYWWSGDQREFGNKPMLGSINTIANSLAFSRVFDKPFFVSEWDEPWPNEWRAECTLYLAAVGALQGWSGFTIHTYRYGTNEDESVTSKIGRDMVLGSSYYRGIFDTYNDPAKFGLFYHAALMMRRGDLNVAEKSVGIKIKDLRETPSSTSALDILFEKNKVGMNLPDRAEMGDEIILSDQCNIDKSQGEVLSDTKQIYRSWEKKIGWIDTDFTKAVYGELGSQDSIELKDTTVKVNNSFAVVAISSLTNEPINKSRNILLTAVGRADNEDIQYNEDHTVQLDCGHGPIMIEVIKADISIKTNQTNLRIWSVNNEGFYTGVIPSTYENGVLKFEIGKEYTSMYYLIQAQ